MSYGGLLLSAVGVVGVVLLAGLVVGVIAGALFIAWRKRQVQRQPADAPSDAVRLDLSSLR